MRILFDTIIIIIIAIKIIWVRKSETRLTRSAAVNIVISVEIIKKKISYYYYQSPD